MSLALAVTAEGLDLVLGTGGLVQDESAGSLLLASLLSDARARDEDLDLIGDDAPRRGWWADEDGARFGSRLWLLERRKINQETLRAAERYARESLEWMVDEGIASRVVVTAIVAAPGAIAIDVTITASRDQRFAFLWRAAREGRFAGIGTGFGWRVV